MLQLEGIERVAQTLKLTLLALAEEATIAEPFEGGLGRIVLLEDLGSVPARVQELERGQEEVEQQGELLLVEVIDQRDELRGVEALIAEALSDVRPVLLFDVRVVVVLVGTTARVVDRALPLCEVVVEMVDVPQWATVSASRYPGRVWSHCSVLMGICRRSSEPGFVVASPILP